MDERALIRLTIDGRWVGYWTYRNGEWEPVPRIAGGDPVTAIALTTGVNLAWQMYQYNNMPDQPVSGGSIQGGPGQQVYDQEGNLVSETMWVPDSSPAGGHWENRSYGDVGKRPEPPGDRPTAPNPRDYDVYGQPPEADMDAPGGSMPGPGPQAPLETPGESNPEYLDAVKKYRDDLAAWEQGTEQYQQDLAAWEEKKKRYDEHQKRLDDLSTMSLETLNKSIDDIAEGYREAETTFRDQQIANLDPQIAEQNQRIREQGMATGQTGGRAEVDRLAALDEAETKAKAEIGRNATMYKYALANQEYSRAMGVYDAVWRTRNADTAAAIQRAGQSQQYQLQQGQMSLAKYATDQNAEWNRYQADLARHNQLTSGVSDTMSGLAYLYGYMNKGGGGGGSPVYPTGGGSGGYGGGSMYMPGYQFK